MSVLLDGKATAAAIHEELQAELASYQSTGTVFQLTVILVGDNPASASYVRSKQRTAERIGMTGDIIPFPESVSEATLLAAIERLNNDSAVDGILVQLPLPQHISEQRILRSIRPDKDVDGFHPMNVGYNVSGGEGVWPCTPSGIIALLDRYQIEIAGKHAVVVGRSNIVGKPMSMLLLARDATVTICHSRTQNLQQYTREADILIVAAGRAKLIRAGDVKPGSVIVDVGMNRIDGKLVGDVDFDQVAPLVSAITPVPGGVGPLTVAMLMKNTIMLGKKRRMGVGQ